MISKREHVDIDFAVRYGINQSMLFVDASRPFALKIMFQRLRFTDASKWVL